MSATFPPLPPELVSFTERGLSTLTGTCDANGIPDCVRAMGVRVWPGACQLTVLIPAASSATSIANLRANGRLAVTLSHIPTHKTVQLKGRVLAIRDGDEADRERAMHYRIKLSEDLAWVGLPAANTLRLGMWPCWAVDLEIEVVYEQTPGPAAGNQMPLATNRP